MGAERGIWDERGRLAKWPSKQPLRQEALRVLGTKFEFGRFYTEKEVNALLTEWHTFGDYFLLRRELVEHALLLRLRNGSRYWRGDFFRETKLPGFSLRGVLPEDAGAVWSIDKACADYTAYSGRPALREEARAVAEAAALPPGGFPAFFHAKLLLPEGGREPAGYFAYYLGYPGGRDVFLASLFLRPEARRKGFGAALVSAFAAQAAQAGARTLHIGVMTENMPGIAFWSAQGFSATGKISPFSDTGKKAERYCRELTPS